MIVKNLCRECKHYQYIDRFLAICNIETKKDFDENGGLTTCQKWEQRKRAKD